MHQNVRHCLAAGQFLLDHNAWRQIQFLLDRAAWCQIRNSVLVAFMVLRPFLGVNDMSQALNGSDWRLSGL